MHRPMPADRRNRMPGGTSWAHTIRDDRDHATHMDDVHFNPAKHALALTAAAWPYSTLLRSVARGLYPSDRAGDGSEIAETGERPDE